MRPNRWACASVLLSWTVVSACAAPTSMADLAGTYVMSIGVDTLHLDSLGRFTRVHVQIGTPRLVSIDRGRWRVSNDRRLAALHDLPQRWPEHGRFDPKTGRWHEADTTLRQTVALMIGSTWRGAVTLGVKPELGWRYRRLMPD